MYYAVVGPDEFSTVFTNWRDVDRIHKLYPYARCRRFKTEEAAWDYVRRYTNKNPFGSMYQYGDTFSNFHVKMRFLVGEDKVYYTFDTSRIGYVKVESDEALITYSGNLINAVLPNTKLNKALISSQMVAIYHGLKIIGPYVDVDIQLHDMSTYYALTMYEGEDHTIEQTRELIDERFAKVSYTLGKERFLI